MAQEARAQSPAVSEEGRKKLSRREQSRLQAEARQAALKAEAEKNAKEKGSKTEQALAQLEELHNDIIAEHQTTVDRIGALVKLLDEKFRYQKSGDKSKPYLSKEQMSDAMNKFLALEQQSQTAMDASELEVLEAEKWLQSPVVDTESAAAPELSEPAAQMDSQEEDVSEATETPKDDSGAAKPLFASNPSSQAKDSTLQLDKQSLQELRGQRSGFPGAVIPERSTFPINQTYDLKYPAPTLESPLSSTTLPTSEASADTDVHAPQNYHIQDMPDEEPDYGAIGRAERARRNRTPREPGNTEPSGASTLQLDKQSLQTLRGPKDASLASIKENTAAGSELFPLNEPYKIRGASVASEPRFGSPVTEESLDDEDRLSRVFSPDAATNDSSAQLPDDDATTTSDFQRDPNETVANDNATADTIDEEVGTDTLRNPVVRWWNKIKNIGKLPLEPDFEMPNEAPNVEEKMSKSELRAALRDGEQSLRDAAAKEKEAAQTPDHTPSTSPDLTAAETQWLDDGDRLAHETTDEPIVDYSDSEALFKQLTEDDKNVLRPLVDQSQGDADLTRRIAEYISTSPEPLSETLTNYLISSDLYPSKSLLAEFAPPTTSESVTSVENNSTISEKDFTDEEVSAIFEDMAPDNAAAAQKLLAAGYGQRQILDAFMAAKREDLSFPDLVAQNIPSEPKIHRPELVSDDTEDDSLYGLGNLDFGGMRPGASSAPELRPGYIRPASEAFEPDISRGPGNLDFGGIRMGATTHEETTAHDVTEPSDFAKITPRWENPQALTGATDIKPAREPRKTKARKEKAPTGPADDDVEVQPAAKAAKKASKKEAPPTIADRLADKVTPRIENERDEDIKMDWYNDYDGLPADDELRVQTDTLRRSWAAQDARAHGTVLVDGDYPPDSTQFKLQTGEALRQVGEMIKQRRDIRARLPKDIAKPEQVVEDVRNKVHNLNLRAKKDFFQVPEVVKNAVGLTLLDSQKSEIKSEQKRLASEAKGDNNENKQKLAWFKVYEKSDNDLLKRRADLIRQHWAKPKKDYTPGSEEYKLQTGEALRQIIEGVVTMSINNKGEVEVSAASVPKPAARKPAARKRS